MAKSYQDRKAQFAANVAKLMAAGFSKTEANKARGYSAAKIQQTIDQGKLPAPAPKQQAARTGKTKEYSEAKRTGKLDAFKPAKTPISKAKTDTGYKSAKGYQEVPNHLNMVFYNRYSYVIEYRTYTKGVDGELVEEIKYLTVTSDEKMSSNEAKQWAKENIIDNPENQEKYNAGKVDLRTMKVIGNWYNPNSGRKGAA